MGGGYESLKIHRHCAWLGRARMQANKEEGDRCGGLRSENLKYGGLARMGSQCAK